VTDPADGAMAQAVQNGRNDGCIQWGCHGISGTGQLPPNGSVFGLTSGDPEDEPIDCPDLDLH